MDIPLLKTKLYIPKTPAELVSRPRLIDSINAGIGHELTLISAPASFGKTTLLSEWVGSCRRPVAWLTLDRDDNDPVHFWVYFIGALRTLQTNLGEAAIAGLRAPPPPPIESVLTTLINDIAEKLPEFVIVLDDYHLITARPVHDALTFLLDHMPANMHIVIAGRADPSLPISRLRANNQLTELRAADLRFTPEETTIFLNNLMKTTLSSENIAVLAARTEGWIVGLQMAALSMQGRENIPEFIAAFSGSHRYVLDYLTDEVLNRQEEKVQSFLLQTSILERLNGPLCDTVTGRSDGQQMLEHLETANLFIAPLDDERRWYRYHQLFADLLRSQFTRTQPELVPALHKRASIWFEKEGLVAEAISHALAGDDLERAANLIEPVALGMIAQNRAVTVSGWLSSLPDDLVAGRPWLCICGAWASLAMRRFDAVEAFLCPVMARLPELPTAPGEISSDERRLQSYLLTIRAFLARASGDLGRAIELSHQASEYAADDDLVVRSTLTLSLGISYWTGGRLQRGQQYIEDASEQAKKAGNYYITLTSMSFLGEIELQLGHLQKATSICQKTIELGTKWGGGEPLPATGYALICLSQVLYEWNRLTDAESCALQGIRLGELSSEAELKVRGYLALARLKQAQGEPDAVREAFKNAYAVRPVFAYLRDQVSCWEARSWLAQGRLAEASQWAATQERALKLSEMPNFASETPYLTLARVKIAKGQTGQIPVLLERLRVVMEEEERINGVLEVLILQALALATLGKMDEAMATLKRALSLAEPEGHIRTFVDQGPPMQQLLRQAARQGIARNYVRSLLKAFPATAGLPLETPAVEHLNERERSILRLMAAGLSNPEIARELYLSLNTIKWYSSHIYSKLGVANRAEAVERAHELKIL